MRRDSRRHFQWDSRHKDLLSDCFTGLCSSRTVSVLSCGTDPVLLSLAADAGGDMAKV